MFLNNTPLYIGTSGYNYEDWKGSFAPADISSYDLLAYYAEKGFNFLELSFTFYRLPEKDKIAHILLRTGEKMRFSVRLPKKLMRYPSDKTLLAEFMNGISPLIESGTLESFFADFLPSFVSSKANYEHLLKLRQAFKGFSFFTELQSRTWYKEKTFDFFRDNDIGLTTIDMPPIKGYAPYYPLSLNYRQYFKLYGRSRHWVSGIDKFLDYSYSDAELENLLSDAVNMSVTSKAIIIIFANLAQGFAPLNALRLKELAEKKQSPAIK
jgi:uncharacterized protein YecE (DUF72 family)